MTNYDVYYCNLQGYQRLDSCEKTLKANDVVSNYEITAAIRKEKNEDSCLIFNKLSNDELKLIFGYVGEKQYGFVVCVSDRFHDVYIDTFRGETLTSISSAAVSQSRAELCLGIEVLKGRIILLMQDHYSKQL